MPHYVSDLRDVLFAEFWDQLEEQNQPENILGLFDLFFYPVIMDRPKQASDDETSYLVSLSHYDTHSLCSDYTLRRHKYESEANAGCYEARQDWIKYVGPIEEFGGCNPINGNFSAVVLPLTKPERLRMIAYVLECTIPVPYGFPITEVVCLLNADAFLYDNMIELEKPETVW